MSYAALSIGLFIFIFSYFTLNRPQTTPDLSTPKAEAVTNFCEDVDPNSAPTFQAPADNVTKTGSEDDETLGTPVEGGGCGGTKIRHILGDLTTYRLIRSTVPLSKTNVDRKGNKNENFDDSSCHFDSAEKLDINIEGLDRTKYKVFYPEIAGEVDIKQTTFSRTRNREERKMYFIDYGLIFLLHLDDKGNFIEHKGGTTKGESETFYLADIYQDTGSGRPDLPEEAFACGDSIGAKNTSGLQIVQPNQSTSSARDQLQLQYFVFDSKSNQVVNGWGIHCKPAIYLYPPKKQLVNVKVYPLGFLTYTDPPYDFQKGWTVEAYPNGDLYQVLSSKYYANQKYDYLYFESKIRDEVIDKPEKGWVVKFNELENLYQTILPKLGLNEKQTGDFIEYWKKALPQSPYYFVGIIDQENVNYFERLEIIPKPDSINRVRIYFERLDSFKKVEAPALRAASREPRADSFAVTEWGGMVKNDPDHPFTCSQ